MAQRESAEQHRRTSSEEADEISMPQEGTTASVDTSARDADVDSILDEIDEVLEENAEEFVKSFVQKGGE